MANERKINRAQSRCSSESYSFSCIKAAGERYTVDLGDKINARHRLHLDSSQ